MIKSHLEMAIVITWNHVIDCNPLQLQLPHAWASHRFITGPECDLFEFFSFFSCNNSHIYRPEINSRVYYTTDNTSYTYIYKSDGLYQFTNTLVRTNNKTVRSVTNCTITYPISLNSMATSTVISHVIILISHQ